MLSSVRISPRTDGKDTKKLWNNVSLSKKSAKNLQIKEIVLIFASSKGEFAERMTTFMAFKGRSEPQI
jgi:hypothetical protein